MRSTTPSKTAANAPLRAASARSEGTDNPCKEAFRQIRPFLREAIVPSSLCERLQFVCQQLRTSGEAGFEVRLAAGADQVDFGLHLERAVEDRKSGVPGFLAAAPDFIIDAADRPAWFRFLDFLHELARDPKGEAEQGIQTTGIWLEFDLTRSSDALPPPGVFLQAHDRRLGSWQDLAARLRGKPFQAATASRIAHVLSCLSPNEHVFLYGFMLSRPVEAIRLNVLGRTPDDLVRWALDAGWPGDPGVLRAAVGELGPLCDRLVFNLDVADCVLPRLGLEIFIEGYRPQPRIATLLEHWQAQGLCSAEKAQALRAWTGVFRPDSATADAPFQVRSINHLKLSLDGQGVREAKAYLLYREKTALPQYAGRQ